MNAAVATTAGRLPDALDQVTQRVVPAGAAPAAAGGPNSIFALGGGAQSEDAPADAADEGATTAWEQRVLDTLGACGALSCVQLQEALGCTRSRVTAVLASLRAAGAIVAVRKEGVVPFYGLANIAPAGGFKGWLQRQGEADASGRAPRAKRGRKPGRSRPTPAAAPAHAELVPLPKAPPPAPPDARPEARPLQRRFARAAGRRPGPAPGRRPHAPAHRQPAALRRHAQHGGLLT